MAAELPVPLLLVLSAALESVVATYAVPQYLPPNPFNWLFLRLAAIQVGLWVLWAVFIYPFFFSPFLDLPRPKVILSHEHCGAARVDICRLARFLSAMAHPCSISRQVQTF